MRFITGKSWLLFILALAVQWCGYSAFSASEAAVKTTSPRVASSSALLVDLQNGHIIYEKDPDQVRPIASLTKLMTAVVLLDSRQPLYEKLKVYIDDTKELKGVRSRLRVGSELTRYDLLLLTLMSSENRAAATLAHYYPGGHDAFIQAMNDKAKSLGMNSTHYVEPTGLSAGNISTARDLVKLIAAVTHYPLIEVLSTTQQKTVNLQIPRSYSLDFRNTNHLVYNDKWSIQLTKTGFTNPAGRCLMMRNVINQRSIGLVVLDALGKQTHFADANRLRNWLETGEVSAPPSITAQRKGGAEKSRRLVANPPKGASVN